MPEPRPKPRICLELEPPGRLRIRVGGASDALEARLERVQGALGGPGDVARGDDDARIWRDAAAFAWVPEGHALVKVPLTPPRVAELEEGVGRLEDVHGAAVPRRFSVGGNVAWLAWPKGTDTEALRDLLTARALAGLAVRGEAFGFGRHDPRIGPRGGGAFLERIASVLDPLGVFDSGPTASDPPHGDRLDPTSADPSPSDPDPSEPDHGSGPDPSADADRSDRAT
jgi:hypothetical protein